MADVVLLKQRVEPAKTDQLREWMAEIRSRRDEAVETLQNEGMYTEATFIESRADGTYLLTFLEVEDIDHAFEAYESSTHELDREHREVLDEVLADDQPEQNIELLYQMTNPERP
ncbi:DUF6176 family protein [Natronorubrum texcoconense]|uniref:Antibiotic biosynthesis monooxygenase n=1 Tax=Natronorubrum texcoconense TaxID=1095776 RepID=A0A1G9DYE0_9EURY|nr:DUF6176 family protein [Natronorubrum texcoconense]SDK68897.1 hypothetical protein SAMN04515672_3680 [Natronorubrum texcoconense]